jgi:hypothetical protein
MRRLLIELRAMLGWWGSAQLVTLVAGWTVIVGAAVFVAVRFRTYGARDFQMIAPLFAMYAYLVAFNLGAAVQVMLADLRRLCVPGRPAAPAGRAGSTLMLVTAVIPAAVLSYLQQSADPALLIAGAVLGALLLSRLPRPLVVTLVVLALILFLTRGMLGQFLGRFPLLLRELLALREVLAQPSVDFVILALILWLWRPVLAGNAAALESAARRAAAWRGGRQPFSGWSSGWFPTLPQGGSVRRPAGVVRTCLGPLYLPGSRAALRLAVQAAVPLAVVVAQFVWTLGWHRGWRVAVFLCLLFIWIVFGLQVSRALQRTNGELAELASIPGLGDRRSQLRALWRASVTTPLVIAAVVSALAILAAHAEAPPRSASIALLGWLGTTTLLGLAFMAGALARRWSAWVDWAALVCVAAALALWVLVEARTGGHVLAVWGGHVLEVWAVLPVIACCLLVANARRLESLPHPFVVRA